MALPRLPGGSARPKVPIIDNSGAALERRIRNSAPPPAPPKIRPIAHTAQRPVGAVQRAPKPSPAPKPPPVVVPNNTGNYSRPKPPPPPAPGKIQGAGGGKGGNNNKPPGKGKHTPLRPIPTTGSVAPPAPDIPAPAALAPPPNIDEWLGTDELYQGTLGSLGSTLSSYDADATTRRSSNATSFAQRLRELQQAQEADELDLKEDFGARGILDSDVYAKALTDLQGQYGGSRTGVESEYAGLENELVTGRAALEQANAAAQQEALAAAIARRAAQYGL